MMMGEVFKITAPLVEIGACKRIVIAITEVSINNRYLMNHEDQYSHVCIPIIFINSCAVFTDNHVLKCDAGAQNPSLVISHR